MKIEKGKPGRPCPADQRTGEEADKMAGHALISCIILLLTPLTQTTFSTPKADG
jgi:hypothetical protein